jgi:hypothetical protein
MALERRVLKLQNFAVGDLQVDQQIVDRGAKGDCALPEAGVK